MRWCVTIAIQYMYCRVYRGFSGFSTVENAQTAGVSVLVSYRQTTPGWQNLASDQLIPTPKFFPPTMFSPLKWCENPEIFPRTMFSPLKWCEKPGNFSSEPHPSADPNQQVTPSSATRPSQRSPRTPWFATHDPKCHSPQLQIPQTLEESTTSAKPGRSHPESRCRSGFRP